MRVIYQLRIVNCRTFRIIKYKILQYNKNIFMQNKIQYMHELSFLYREAFLSV